MLNVARLESLEFFQPFGLFHVAMDLAGGETMALKAGGEFAHGGLAVREDDRGADIFRFEQAAQHVALGARRRHVDQLLIDQEIG